MIMDFKEDIKGYFGRLKSVLDSVDVAEIDALMQLLVGALEEGRQIFVMGNGGSAATASHFVCDFNKGLSLGKKSRFKFICLNDNVPTMMAYANDLSYDDIFVEPLKNYFRRGDVVMGISGSGNSPNVIRAIEWANANGGVTVGLTGFNGGKLKRIAQQGVHIPVDDMQITEDLHMVLDHCMMKILDGYLL
jgi:D-sedoheptulose 7-phosphate isomerase